jgi:hypothetical protein
VLHRIRLNDSHALDPDAGTVMPLLFKPSCLLGFESWFVLGARMRCRTCLRLTGTTYCRVRSKDDHVGFLDRMPPACPRRLIPGLVSLASPLPRQDPTA